ncbi:MAG: hypothetical protein GX894_07640 [Clostridia bacterium]|nr:hypothetical protein [Clostridia bacterium]
MKRTSILLLAFLLTLVVGGAAMAQTPEAEASHELTVTIPPDTKFELEGTSADFGTIDAAGSYKTGEFNMTYRCNKKTDWYIEVSAGKFVDEDGKELPASALNLYFGDETYDILGKTVVVDDAGGPQTRTTTVSYELVLSESNFDAAYASEYSNTVTYTLFVK